MRITIWESYGTKAFDYYLMLQSFLKFPFFFSLNYSAKLTTAIIDRVSKSANGRKKSSINISNSSSLNQLTGQLAVFLLFVPSTAN